MKPISGNAQQLECLCWVLERVGKKVGNCEKEVPVSMGGCARNRPLQLGRGVLIGIWCSASYIPHKTPYIILRILKRRSGFWRI